MSFWNKKKIVIVNYDVDEKKKKISKKIYFFSIILLLAIFTIWGVISLSTTDNFISKETRKILSKAGIYTKPVENTITESNDNYGNWTISKNAKWINSSNANVTLELESDSIQKNINKDIIFIIDTSESMNGTRLEKLKEKTNEVINEVLDNNSNRIAVITFNETAKVISDFTSDKDTLTEKINSLQTGYNTNYYAGLKSIYDILKNYSKDDNNELVTIFITDGKPNKSASNGKNIYKALKEKYSYIKIYGVQYEMNLKKPVEDIKNISDQQWIANQSNIGEVLKETLAFTEQYQQMIITDYINTNYFKIKDEKNIVATTGNVKLEEVNGIQKITWNLKDKYATGSKQQLSFEVILKDEYQDQAGLYPIIKSESVEYMLHEKNKTVTDYETPVLNTKYNVLYDVNSPKECSLNKVESEEKIIYQNVSIKNEIPNCENYIFEGWELVEQDIKKINDDTFVMPGHDVTLRGIWTKPKLNMSMEGQVYQSSKIYKVLEDAAKNNSYVVKYTGEHKDTFKELKDEKAIYYFTDENKNNYTINEKNNVIFANHCWKIIRTTDDGGVKLLYNGEPDNNDQCTTDRNEHVEIKNIIETNPIKLEWYYADNYEFDSINKNFKLQKNVTKYDLTNYQELDGKYTCALTNEDGTCQMIYYIQKVINPTSAKVVVLTISDKYNQIASSNYNKTDDSPAYIGYKYGDVYKKAESQIIQEEKIANSETIIKNIQVKNKQFLYSDEITYNVNQYTLVNPITPVKIDDESLKGKYTMFKTDNQSDSKVYQIIGVDESIIYYAELTNGLITTKDSIIVGDSITDNNGNYLINNPQEISLRKWFEKPNEYNGKYSCFSSNNICENVKYIVETTNGTAKTINANGKIVIAKNRNNLNLIDYKYVTYDQLIKDGSTLSSEGYKYTCNNVSTTCSENELRLITSYTKEGYSYVSNHYYGTSAVWDGINYVLQNTIDIENYNNIDMLATHHYVCIESGNKMCNKVGYIYAYNDGIIYYVLLENGVLNIDTIKDNMFKKNTTDSNIKKIVETWYEIYLKKYSDYIDNDTIYCNNRLELNNNGWNEKNSNFKETLKFKGKDDNDNNLNCQNITDQFSYNNEYAKLNYPIGLATSQELSLSNLLNNKLSTNSYWTMTPSEFNNTSSFIKVFDEDNNSYSVNANSSLSIRPVITLKENTEFDDGDGTTINPYHINVGEE